MNFFILCLITISFACAKDLKLERIAFLDNDSEISGLIVKDNHILFIADKPFDYFIYKTQLRSKKLKQKIFLDLRKVDNFYPYYFNNLISYKNNKFLKSPLDLEAIAYCDDIFYLANEQVRDVLKIENNKLSILKLDLKSAFESLNTDISQIDVNAGFEGLSLDCKKNHLYLAQERSPRAILVFDLNESGRLIKVIQTDESNNSNPDYAGLHFENNFLYILERNMWRILKLDTESFKVVDSYSFKRNDKINLNELYDTKEIYGLAEAIYLTEDQIIIGIDNNKKPLSKKAQNIFKLSGNNSSIIFFKRPKGF